MYFHGMLCHLLPIFTHFLKRMAKCTSGIFRSKSFCAFVTWYFLALVISLQSRSKMPCGEFPLRIFSHHFFLNLCPRLNPQFLFNARQRNTCWWIDEWIKRTEYFSFPFCAKTKPFNIRQAPFILCMPLTWTNRGIWFKFSFVRPEDIS